MLFNAEERSFPSAPIHTVLNRYERANTITVLFTLFRLKRERCFRSFFPGYDLAAPAPLARLPYGSAALLWQLLLWLSVAVTIISMRRLTKIPLAVLIAVFLFSDGYVSSPHRANCSCGACGSHVRGMKSISRRRFVLSALGVTVSLCEPHIGIASFIAVFLFCSLRTLDIACMRGVSRLSHICDNRSKASL